MGREKVQGKKGENIPVELRKEDRSWDLSRQYFVLHDEYRCVTVRISSVHGRAGFNYSIERLRRHVAFCGVIVRAYETHQNGASVDRGALLESPKIGAPFPLIAPTETPPTCKAD
jgi:hypothetical protein